MTYGLREINPHQTAQPCRPRRLADSNRRSSAQRFVHVRRPRRRVNVGSLFSGIGGMDEGLRRAGWDHAFLCESDGWRRGVLRERFPGVPIYDDVRDCGRQPDAVAAAASEDSQRGRSTSDVAEWREGASGTRDSVDLLCGGFPCQDLSVAGRRAGLDGTRSSLFFEFARIADALRPQYLLVENVPGLLSSNGGRDFGIVLGTLADIGYGLAWRILDSRYFGVPQRRRRVFVVAVLADRDPAGAAERAGEILAVGQGCARHLAKGGEAGADVAYALADGSGNRTGSGRDGQDTLIAAPLSHGSNPNSNMAGRRREDDENLVVAGPLGGGNDGIGRRSEDDPNLVLPQTFDWQMDGGNDKSWGGKARSWIHDTPGRTRALSTTKTLALYQPQTAGVRRLTPVECERLQALPDGWTEVPKGAPDSRRCAALGDAVTASVAEWIGHRLLAHLNAGRMAEDMQPTKGTGSFAR